MGRVWYRGEEEDGVGPSGLRRERTGQIGPGDLRVDHETERGGLGWDGTWTGGEIG